MAKFNVSFFFIFSLLSIFDSNQAFEFATVYNKDFLAKITPEFVIVKEEYTPENIIGSLKEETQSNNISRSIEEGNLLFENGVKNLSAYNTFKELPPLSQTAVVISGYGRHGIYGAVIAKKLLEEGAFVLYIRMPNSSGEIGNSEENFLAERSLHDTFATIDQETHNGRLLHCILFKLDQLNCLNNDTEKFDIDALVKESMIRATLFFDSCQGNQVSDYFITSFTNSPNNIISIGLPMESKEKSGLKFDVHAMVFVNFAEDFYGRSPTENSEFQYDFFKTEIVIVRIEKFFDADINTISNLKLAATSITTFTPNYNSIEVSKEITNEYFKLHPLSGFRKPTDHNAVDSLVSLTQTGEGTCKISKSG